MAAHIHVTRNKFQCTILRQSFFPSFYVTNNFKRIILNFSIEKEKKKKNKIEIAFYAEIQL